MSNRPHNKPNFIYPPGTQVVTQQPVLRQNGKIAHPSGAVGVITKSPTDQQHEYRVRFTDGYETMVPHQGLMQLSEYKEGSINDSEQAQTQNDLFDRVIFRCVIGSRAYGLDDENSDIDRRGIYLPPADLHWSLHGVPEQIENESAQECYWEIQKFVSLALKANPNVLECLYSPIVELATPLTEELLNIKSIFLSKLVFQTYNGYVMSQFKKMQGDIRNHEQVKWKHVMHLIRLLHSGIHVLRHGIVSVQVGENRDKLVSIKRGEVSWEQTENWRLELHREFEIAAQETILPERPDYERANAFLLKARRFALDN